MGTRIRKLELTEYDVFMRFLERCYGLSPGTVERLYPHRYRPTPELCDTAYVVERGGQIVSHVGLYPLEIHVQGITLPVGGIGAVGTAAAERGGGHMSALLWHTVDEMRARGHVLSWLSGDRTRYKAFGWEQAGPSYQLTFSRRSLERCGAEPIEIEARYPEDATDVVARYYSERVCYARRTRLDLQLGREGLRVWTAEDGYAIAWRAAYGGVRFVELFSASGRELGLARALLDWMERDEFSWEIPACDGERLARVLPGAASWRSGSWDMWRVVDLGQLLALYAPLLAQRAAGLRDAALAIGICDRDRTDQATLAVRDGLVEVTAGRASAEYVEWTPVEAVRVLLGGPSVAPSSQGPSWLRALLPLPVYLTPLDHV